MLLFEWWVFDSWDLVLEGWGLILSFRFRYCEMDSDWCVICYVDRKRRDRRMFFRTWSGGNVISKCELICLWLLSCLEVYVRCDMCTCVIMWCVYIVLCVLLIRKGIFFFCVFNVCEIKMFVKFIFFFFKSMFLRFSFFIGKVGYFRLICTLFTVYFVFYEFWRRSLVCFIIVFFCV